MSSKTKGDRNNSELDGASPGKIFVGGLPKDTSMAIFLKHFGKYGEIIDSVIMKDRHTQQPRGFGFITYADPSVVDQVMEDTHIINGKQVEIKRTIPKGSVQSKDFKTKKIFVGGVPSNIAEDDFKGFFSKFGKVVDHEIIRDHTTKRSRGFGFIIFDSEKVVDDLVSKGNMIDLADIEEAAAKRSVEEQKQKTAIDAMEKDLLLVRSKSTCLIAESEEMEKERAQICYQILEKQKKISSLENETTTLSQSLELLRQQTVGASTTREEKRSYFAKVMEDSVITLQKQHDWLSLYKKQMETSNLVKEHSDTTGEMDLDNMRKKMSRRCQDLMRLVESKKNECEELKVKKSELDEEKVKSNQIMQQLKQKFETFTAALKTLDVEALQEEHKALLADEAGEMEYLKSLEDQIKQVKNVSHAVKCHCGEEYMVELIG